MRTAEVIWGIRNNLCKVMAYCPRLMQTEVEYANSFIFDAAHLSRRSARVGLQRPLSQGAGHLADRACQSLPLLGDPPRLHGHGAASAARAAPRRTRSISTFTSTKSTPRSTPSGRGVVLDYTVKVAQDAHLVSDEEFQALRRVLRDDDLKDPRLNAPERRRPGPARHRADRGAHLAHRPLLPAQPLVHRAGGPRRNGPRRGQLPRRLPAGGPGRRPPTQRVGPARRPPAAELRN